MSTEPACAAGRNLIHPTNLGWMHPCPDEPTEQLVLVQEDGSRHPLLFCRKHFDDLPKKYLSHDLDDADLN